MAQNQRRMIYSKIWTSQQVGHLTPQARLLYIGMITLADDDGRLVGDPSYLRGQVFPYDSSMTIDDVILLRNEILTAGLIDSYKIDNFDYIQHPNWSEYQVIRGDLYKPSKLPDRNGRVTKPLRTRNKNVIQDKLSKDKLSKDNNIYRTNFEIFYNSYPRKIGKENAYKVWVRLAPLEELSKKIISSVAEHLKTEQWQEDVRFIPHPATYLNQKRWEDEIKIKDNSVIKIKHYG